MPETSSSLYDRMFSQDAQRIDKRYIDIRLLQYQWNLSTSGNNGIRFIGFYQFMKDSQDGFFRQFLKSGFYSAFTTQCVHQHILVIIRRYGNPYTVWIKILLKQSGLYRTAGCQQSDRINLSQFETNMVQQ